jgi:hypothetical protein
MTPKAAYNRFNKIIWNGRLPKAIVTLVDDAVIPKCFGLTLFDDDFAQPVIYLAARNKRWIKTLIHEMIHVAEPSLPHGKLFNALVETYWRYSKVNAKKGYRRV